MTEKLSCGQDLNKTNTNTFLSFLTFNKEPTSVIWQGIHGSGGGF